MSETCDCSECKQDRAWASGRKHAAAIAAAEERGRRRGVEEASVEAGKLRVILLHVRRWMRADSPSWVKAEADTALGPPKELAPRGSAPVCDCEAENWSGMHLATCVANPRGDRK